MDSGCVACVEFFFFFFLNSSCSTVVICTKDAFKRVMSAFLFGSRLNWTLCHSSLRFTHTRPKIFKTGRGAKSSVWLMLFQGKGSLGVKRGEPCKDLQIMQCSFCLWIISLVNEWSCIFGLTDKATFATTGFSPKHTFCAYSIYFYCLKNIMIDSLKVIWGFESNIQCPISLVCDSTADHLPGQQGSIEPL